MNDPTSVIWRCTAQRSDGSFCDVRAIADAPFPICREHAERLIEHFGGSPVRVLPAPPRMFTDEEKALHDRRHQDRKAYEARRYQRMQDQSQVYYVRIGDHVKIGYSINMRQRLGALRVADDALLATEPGGRERERERHVQFADERIGRREDFNPSRRLLAHIEAVKAEHGAPNITTYRNGAA